MNRKVYLITSVSIILILICCSIVFAGNNSVNKKTISAEQAKELLGDLPSKDYSRDYEKSAQLLTKFANKEEVDNIDISTVISNKEVNRQTKKQKDITDTTEEMRLRLSSGYRAYKNNTLTYDILISEIESEISARLIQLQATASIEKDGVTLTDIQKREKDILEETIKDQESLLNSVKGSKDNDNGDLYKLYEEYSDIQDKCNKEVKNNK